MPPGAGDAAPAAPAAPEPAPAPAVAPATAPAPAKKSLFDTREGTRRDDSASDVDGSLRKSPPGRSVAGVGASAVHVGGGALALKAKR